MTIEQIQTPAPLVAGSTGANLIREAAAVMADAHALASAVASTQMIPKHFQGKPDECAAAMLYGASLGLDPMQSVRQIYVVHGQAALYARAMSALVQGAGHKVWTVESTDESVTVAGSRRGNEHVETSTWTFARANKAGYTNNAKYKTDPQAMLYSKALSEVCRKVAPDVLSGVYAVEELQMERWDSEQPTQAAPQAAGDRLRAALRPTVTAEQFDPEPDGDSPDELEADGAPVGTASESITAAQVKKIATVMGTLGIVDRDSALLYVNDVLPEGREVASRNELTKDEAHAVIEALEAEAAQS